MRLAPLAGTVTAVPAPPSIVGGAVPSPSTKSNPVSERPPPTVTLSR